MTKVLRSRKGSSSASKTTEQRKELRRDRHIPKRNRRRNAGVSAHRPKGAMNGKRIGEALHPGPGAKCSVKNCDHTSCTTLGHFHRPKAHDGVKRRLTEKKGKNGSSKPARYTVCKLHLEAGKCGVALPHGHCGCDATAHHHALLTQHIEDVHDEHSHNDREPALSWEFDAFRDRLSDDGRSHHHAQFPDRAAELTAAYEKDEFVFQEAAQYLLDEERKGAPHKQQPQPAGVSSKLITAGQPDDEPSDDESDEMEESSSDDSSDESDSDDESRFTWVDSLGSEEEEEREEDASESTFETKKMLVYLNVQVGEENLSIWKRLANSFLRHIPFTRLDTVTTVNGVTADTVDESLTLRPTNESEVKAFWRTRDDAGHRLSSALGHMALFRDLLPSCMEAEVYSDILSKATRDAKLNKQAVLTKNMDISRALGPIVSDYVYSQAGGDSQRNPTTLLWTTVAVMNQLTASAIVKLAAGSGTGLDFRTRGRSRTLR